ncbi:hypothetical protein ACFW9W_36930, partial [Streptomyces sp. NPDC059468]
MTDDAYRAALTRLAVDPAFRAELDGDTDEVARRLGLSPAQVGELRSLRVESGTDGGPAALDPRLSKSSLFFGGAAHALAHHDVPADHAVSTDHVSGDHDAAGPASAGHSSELPEPAAGQEGGGGIDVASTGSHSLLGGPLLDRSPAEPIGGPGEFGDFGDFGGFGDHGNGDVGADLGGHVGGGAEGGFGDFGAGGDGGFGGAEGGDGGIGGGADGGGGEGAGWGGGEGGGGGGGADGGC